MKKFLLVFVSIALILELIPAPSSSKEAGYNNYGEYLVSQASTAIKGRARQNCDLTSDTNTADTICPGHIDSDGNCSYCQQESTLPGVRCRYD